MIPITIDCNQSPFNQ